MSSSGTFPVGCSSDSVARTRRRRVIWNEPHAGGITVWFTGLSGAGKSTLALALASELRGVGLPTVVLDAEVLRHGLCKGLGFSRADRAENARRIAEVARRLTVLGNIVLVAAITPYRDVRAAARKTIGRFVEVYVNAPLGVCIERDRKGLYARALAGEVRQFTGISDPYEEPLAPDLECRTDRESVEECVVKLMRRVMSVAEGQYVGVGAEG